MSCSNYHFCLCHRAIWLLLPTRQLWKWNENNRKKMFTFNRGVCLCANDMVASQSTARSLITTYHTNNRWKIFREWNIRRCRQSCRRPWKSQLNPNFVLIGNCKSDHENDYQFVRKCGWNAVRSNRLTCRRQCPIGIREWWVPLVAIDYWPALNMPVPWWSCQCMDWRMWMPTRNGQTWWQSLREEPKTHFGRSCQW